MKSAGLQTRRNDGPPEKCDVCPLRAIVLYAPAVGNYTDSLKAIRGETVTVGPRQIIAREREIPKQVYSLYSGWAFEYRLLPDGRRQIFAFLMPGDFIGIRPLIHTPMSYSVQSLTQVNLCAFSTDGLTRLFQGRSDLKDQITQNFFHESSFLASRLIDVGRRSATERVVHLILDIEKRAMSRGLVSDRTIPFPLRQTHIADALGLTAVHVNRTINALRREGLIVIGRGALTIEDRDALEEISGSSK
jgi:CRP-like cAMP-binding protein